GEAKSARSLAELRALPAATFFAPAGAGGVTVPNSPFNDGWVLTTETPAEQVPIMTGFVADDFGVSRDAAQKAASRDRIRGQIDQWAANQVKSSKRIYTYYFSRVL